MIVVEGVPCARCKLLDFDRTSLGPSLDLSSAEHLAGELDDLLGALPQLALRSPRDC